MSVQRIASRYAKSLIGLAVEQKKLDRIFEDVQAFKALLSNRDLYLLMKSPIVKADKKQQIFHLLFKDHFDPLMMAFLDILVRKGRETHLPEVADEFIAQYKRARHISTVKLTTAVDLGEAAIGAILKKLEGSSVIDETIELKAEVDPELLGGFVIEFEDRIYDASVSNKLDELRREFKDNLYISQIISR